MRPQARSADTDAINAPATDLAGILARFRTPAGATGAGTGDEAPPGTFPIEHSRFLKRQRHAETLRETRVARRFVKPANAGAVIPHLPGRGEHTHCVVRGDFVLCDLIEAIVRARGGCRTVTVASLGLNEGNVATFCRLLDAGLIGHLDLVLSHYFGRVDSHTHLARAQADLVQSGRACRLAIARSHAKVVLLDTLAGDCFCIEGSANLRASCNVEQFVITNDREVFAFHEAWLAELLTGGALT